MRLLNWLVATLLLLCVWCSPTQASVLVNQSPQVGESVSKYWEYVNGSPPAGTVMRIDSDLGLPAVHASMRSGISPSPDGTWRNQVGGIKRLDGSRLTFSNGETQWYVLRMRLGPLTSFQGSFTTLFSWTSFINNQGSGPQQFNACGQSGRSGLSFSVAFACNNLHASLAFPGEWTDYLVGVNYKTDSTGWVELYQKSPDATTWTQAFRYVGRTTGDTVGDNRYGVYGGAASNVDIGLNRLIVATTRAEAEQALQPSTQPAPTALPPAPKIEVAPRDASADVSLVQPLSGARPGDFWQVYVNGTARKLDIPLSQTTYRITSLTNGTTYSIRASLGQPSSYGPWTDPAVSVRPVAGMAGC